MTAEAARVGAIVRSAIPPAAAAFLAVCGGDSDGDSGSGGSSGGTDFRNDAAWLWDADTGKVWLRDNAVWHAWDGDAPPAAKALAREAVFGVSIGPKQP